MREKSNAVYFFYPLLYREVMRFPFKRRKEIEKFKNEKLHWLVLHAFKNVPFYRRYWNKNKVNIDEIKTVEDLEKMPIVKREDLMKNPKDFIAQNYSPFLTTLTTSGTSRRPLTLFYNPLAVAYNDLVFYRTLKFLGYNNNYPLVYYWYEKYKTLFEKLGPLKRTIIDSNSSEEEQLKILQLLNPKFLLYFPISLFLISKLAIENNISFEAERIFTQAEILTNTMRRKIRKAFNCELFDLYGSFEAGFIAFECLKHKHYHVNEDLVVLEDAIDENGFKTAIVTNLHNKIMPIIRYAQDDIIKLSRNSCNIFSLSTLKSIEGRRKEIIKHKSRYFTLKEIAEKINKINSVYNFQIIKDKTYKIKIQGKRPINAKSFPSIFQKVNYIKSIKKNRYGKYSIFQVVQ